MCRMIQAYAFLMKRGYRSVRITCLTPGSMRSPQRTGAISCFAAVCPFKTRPKEGNGSRTSISEHQLRTNAQGLERIRWITVVKALQLHYRTRLTRPTSQLSRLLVLSGHPRPFAGPGYMLETVVLCLQCEVNICIRCLSRRSPYHHSTLLPNALYSEV